MFNCILIHPSDNVLVVTKEVRAGESLVYSCDGRSFELTARQAIPIYHKAARSAISIHQEILKYGEIIGLATKEIAPGEHVHVHNITSTKKNEGEDS